MLTRFRNTARIAALGLGGLLATGCFYNETPDSEPAGPKPAPSVRCADLSADQQAKGDALVAKAQAMQAADIEMMANRDIDWQTIETARIKSAISLYDQALAVAPGHCGAVFGKAMAQGMLLIQDQAVNEAVNHSLGKQGGAPLAKAFKTSAAEAAPIVLQVASGLGGSAKPFITAQQDRFADEVLPKLDTVIAALEAAMAQADFSVRFVRADGSPVEFDKGEIGPVLGGLKVAKAIVLLLAGVSWEIAKDGSYAWMDDLSNLNPSQFKNLTAAQRQSLDHLTSLFAVGSPFTRVKAGWKESIKGIPALLLSAVESAQAGLRYAIAESKDPSKQTYDVIKVGTGELDDVDPADLEGVIDALERTKKYLRGEVALVYHKTTAGKVTHTLKVVFPKVFQWDGLQNHLPFYKLNPYEQWVAPSDRPEDVMWGSWLGWEAHNLIEQALGYSGMDAVGIETSATGFRVELHEEWDFDATRPSVLLAELTPDAANPCKLNYVKTYSRVRDNSRFGGGRDNFLTVPGHKTGVIDLGATCRVTAAGAPEYLEWGSLEFKSPFYFTDAAGRKTLAIDEVEESVETLGLAGALTGKIVFRDPTFGGVFPELTNDNIWTVVQSLDEVGPRLEEKCGEHGCEPVLDNNPSDLDVWARYLFWLDNIF